MAAHDVEAGPKKLIAGATLLLEDESGFTLTPFVAKTWSPVSETPTLVHSFGPWEKLSAISGIAVRLRDGRLEAALYFRLLPGVAVRNGHVADFLRQVGRHRKGKVIVLWDNAGQHRGPALRSFFEAHGRFEAVPLPPYCPELNPDEDVWGWVKKDLANLCALDDEDLRRRVRASLGRIQRSPGLVEACLGGSELSWRGLLTQPEAG